MDKESNQNLPKKQAAAIQAALLDDSVRRATIFSFLLVIVFTAYGFTSYDFLIRFRPSLSLWGNLWQRILLNSLPMLSLGLYLRYANASNQFKIIVWMLCFCIVFHVGAWINVWPILLEGKPSILTYVHAANVYLFAFCYIFVSPPGRYLWLFTGLLFLLFVGPLFVIGYVGNDPVILKLTINDTLFTVISGLAGSQMIQSLRKKLARFEIEKEEQAEKFLGPIVSEAIYGNRSELLSDWRGVALVATLDIRESTELQHKHGAVWLEFRRAYFNAVSGIVSKHQGYIQKTVGDSHIIDFGILDYQPDLSDIPGLEGELASAEERRLKKARDNAFTALTEIYEDFIRLSNEFFPGEKLCLGGGVDEGMVERHLQGDFKHRIELDVNGVPVNCSARLQEYSKRVLIAEGITESILVVSPSASSGIGPINAETYIRFQTGENPIRNFSEIAWVMYRVFLTQKHSDRQAA